MAVVVLGLRMLLFLYYLYKRRAIDKDNLIVNKNETKNTLAGYTQFIQYLSKRELEIVEAVLDGNFSYKEISTALNISVNTVKTHLRHIYKTTGVSNIAALSSLFHGFTLVHP